MNSGPPPLLPRLATGRYPDTARGGVGKGLSAICRHMHGCDPSQSSVMSQACCTSWKSIAAAGRLPARLVTAHAVQRKHKDCHWCQLATAADAKQCNASQGAMTSGVACPMQLADSPVNKLVQGLNQAAEAGRQAEAGRHRQDHSSYPLQHQPLLARMFCRTATGSSNMAHGRYQCACMVHIYDSL